MRVSHNSVISENTQHLNIPGITPIIFYGKIDGENVNGERMIKFEAMRKNDITNKYIKCLHDIIWYWDNSYYVLDTLIRHGVINKSNDYSMKWTLNKTSLAWLFKKMKTINNEDNYSFHIPGGFWNPISVLFGEKKEILKRLAHNKITYGGQSQDIEKLKTILKENNIDLCA